LLFFPRPPPSSPKQHSPVSRHLTDEQIAVAGSSFRYNFFEYMESHNRHQCLIYEGAPSKQLAALAAVAHEKLSRNCRCLYLNSRPMVAGMRSYLAATGLDVQHELAKGSLVLSSDQGHLIDGLFDIDTMIDTLNNAIRRALDDGYAGLWASGDMGWEMGPDQDFSKLLEYESRLEQLFHQHPELSGICQYHASTMPMEAVREGFYSHRSLFINETLSVLNPSFLQRSLAGSPAPASPC
jgi:hypothetical protein